MSDPDPEETAPFTHQPYGGPPPPPPVPGVPPPYASGPPVPYPYPSPYVGQLSHQGATTAMWLGIVSVASLALGLFCCVTFPLVLCAPFAWGVGSRAKKAIDAQPGVYSNRSQAQAGVVMGIIGTVLGSLAIVAFAALFLWIGIADPSLV